MTAWMNSSLVSLKQRVMIELEEENCTIACMTGLLWVTQLGSGQDVILEPGQSMVLAGRRSTVVQGLGYSTMALARPVRATRLGEWFRRLNFLRTYDLRDPAGY